MRALRRGSGRRLRIYRPAQPGPNTGPVRPDARFGGFGETAEARRAPWGIWGRPCACCRAAACMHSAEARRRPALWGSRGAYRLESESESADSGVSGLESDVSPARISAGPARPPRHSPLLLSVRVPGQILIILRVNIFFLLVNMFTSQHIYELIYFVNGGCGTSLARSALRARGPASVRAVQLTALRPPPEGEHGAGRTKGISYRPSLNFLTVD